jgi:hypothetical protein
MKKSEILIDLSESKKTKYGKEDFALQSRPQRVFSAIWKVEGEVNNGGFSQYFANDAGESTSFIVEALEIVAAPKMAGICKRAIAAAFPTGLPRSPESIGEITDNFSDEILAELNGLDHEYFGCPEELTDLLFEFVSKHPEEFGILPEADDV